MFDKFKILLLNVDNLLLMPLSSTTSSAVASTCILPAGLNEHEHGIEQSLMLHQDEANSNKSNKMEN